MGADLEFCRARLGELRVLALRLDKHGDVRGLNDDTWAQANELAAVLGDEVGDILGLMRNDGRWSAWLYDPQWLLKWRQPDSWEACCRLYAADVAERALDLYGGNVDPRSREAIRVARLHARGRASDAELQAVRDAVYATAQPPVQTAQRLAAHPARVVVWPLARNAARDAAWSARNAAGSARATTAAGSSAEGREAAEGREGRIQWRRLFQYAEHGPSAAEMEWEVNGEK